MKNTILLLALLLALASCGGIPDSDCANRAYLERLDSALNKKSEYRKAMDTRLMTLKQKRASAQGIEALYFYNRIISENYSSFIPDSAFYYIEKNCQLAARHGKTDWQVESHLAKAKIYSAIGMLDSTSVILREVARWPMSREMKLEYYIQQIHYWSQYSIYLDVPMRGEVQAYGDSILSIETSKTSPYYLWGRFWNEKDPEKKGEVLRLITDKLALMEGEEAWYGPLCFAAGILSAALGNDDDALKYYVEGLCMDISHVSRSLPTLPMVAVLACRMGEMSYSNRFMKAYISMQSEFPDRARIVSLSQPMSYIYDETIARLDEEARMRNGFMVCLVVLLLALLALLVFVIRLFRKQVSLRKALSVNNKKMEENLRQLTDYQGRLQVAHDSLAENGKLLEKANANLQEANYLKEEYIGNLFSICSDYLVRTSDLKKSILRKLKARQYDDLVKMMTGEAQTDAEVKELNKHFDTIFLSIFPGFVEEFNALLRPEERISLRTGDSLNTDLRIYALVRLGINNSVKIAKILGVSSQTVYNARMKMRARVTESDEDLVHRVRKLGGKKQASELPPECF